MGLARRAQGARRRRCGAIVDDEQRSDRRATVDRTNERAFSKRLSYQAAVELPIKSHYVNYPGNPLDLRMRF
jgi:hypothetical protein